MNRLQPVARICNLLYRRFSTCGAARAFAKSAGCNSTIRRIRNLRYFVGLFALLALSPGNCLFAQADETNAATVRFLAVDLFVDSKGKPLAAYQLEFSVTNGNARIVGIEGGEHPAFREPPHYDPKAMQQERVIIAAFSTELVPKLPTGRKRVATIHIQVNGTVKPEFAVKLQVAADAQAKIIPVEAAVEERQTK